MGTTDPDFGVQFVPRFLLRDLPTTKDPTGLLRTRVGSPFRDWLQLSNNRNATSCGSVAFTVVSRLDEPVVGVYARTPAGTLRGRPAVRAGTTAIEPTTIGKLSGGHDGCGWIDPTGSDRLVSVGTWLVNARDFSESDGNAAAVLHLRCASSRVDILVASIANHRWSGDGLGGWNPYGIALHEPGELGANLTDADYDAFLAKAEKGATSADQHGSSLSGAVSYLSRSPQGFLMALQHVVVLLAPEPVADGWDRGAPPEPLGVTSARAMTGAPAPLDPVVPGIHYTVASAADPSLVLDVDRNSTADSAAVQLYPRNGGQNQQWRFEPSDRGGFTVVARHSGKCLDVTGASTDAGAAVIQYAAHGADNQRWTREATTGSGFLLRAAHSGQVLDAKGGAAASTPLIQHPVDGGKNQLWIATPVGS